MADQDLAVMESLRDETKAISTYLHEGVTLQRLKAIATNVRENGGLNMFSDSSEEYALLFNMAAPRDQKDRKSVV